MKSETESSCSHHRGVDFRCDDTGRRTREAPSALGLPGYAGIDGYLQPAGPGLPGMVSAASRGEDARGELCWGQRRCLRLRGSRQRLAGGNGYPTDLATCLSGSVTSFR